MIDWLELLWLAEEEGTEFALPEEVTLPAAAKVTETEENTPGEPHGEIPEGEESVRQRRRRTLSEPGAENWQEQAQFERVWGRVLPASFSNPAGTLTAQRLSRKAADSALTDLYRRVRESVSPILPGVSEGRGRVVVREEISAATGLTEEGLDRSLRRDSRRYDGGMSIY